MCSPTRRSGIFFTSSFSSREQDTLKIYESQGSAGLNVHADKSKMSPCLLAISGDLDRVESQITCLKISENLLLSQHETIRPHEQLVVGIHLRQRIKGPRLQGPIERLALRPYERSS